jgi:hypothetical protein
MCFNDLKGDRMADIDASQPVRQISIVGNASPEFSNKPSVSYDPNDSSKKSKSKHFPLPVDPLMNSGQ